MLLHDGSAFPRAECQGSALGYLERRKFTDRLRSKGTYSWLNNTPRGLGIRQQGLVLQFSRTRIRGPFRLLRDDRGHGQQEIDDGVADQGPLKYPHSIDAQLPARITPRCAQIQDPEDGEQDAGEQDNRHQSIDVQPEHPRISRMVRPSSPRGGAAASRSCATALSPVNEDAILINISPGEPLSG